MNNLLKKNMQESRIFYLDLLRIISTLGIMILHLSSQYWYVVDPLSFEWKIFNVYDSCTRWAVPVFVMISGYLFLNKQSSDSIEKIHKKNVLRIITCFCFWSLLYSVIYFFVMHYDAETVMVNFIKGQGFMWFLYMIVGIYLIIPFLRKIIESEKLMKYFLILSFIFSIFLPQMINIVGLLNTDYQEIFNEIYNKIDLKFVCGYVFYFVLGYFLGIIQISRKKRFAVYILGLFGFIGTVLVSDLLTNITGKANGMFYDNFSFGIMLESISIFVFAKYCFSRFCTNHLMSNTIVVLSNVSFGAFLLHILVIESLDLLFDLNVLSFNPIFSIPVFGIIVFIISFSVSYLLSRIPFVGKYIV